MTKKILILLVIMGLSLSVTAPSSVAQMNIEDEIELTKSYIESNRKLIVAATLDLTEEESKTFWPVYKEYREDVDGLSDRTIALIKKYGENYENLTDAVASELMTEYLDIEEDKLIYKRIYTDHLSGILPVTKVARFLQIENKMDAVIKFDVASEIPLIMDKEEAEKEQL